jgi:hypothetical protein
VSRQDGAPTQSLSEAFGFKMYELGHRKRSAFLTILPFVLRYAQLLLVLGDEMSVQALLTRVIAACEAKEKQDATPRGSLGYGAAIRVQAKVARTD